MAYIPLPFMIRCLTNLHAGSGKNDFGAIDNLIQRDAATHFPCINDSSLKGALRIYMENDPACKNIVEQCFGKESRDGSDTETGAYLFQQAYLLSMPVRSNTLPFYRVTCPQLILDIADRLEFFETGETQLIMDLRKIVTDFNANELKENSNEDSDDSSAVYTGTIEPITYLEEFEIKIGSSNLGITNEGIKKLFGAGGDFVIVSDKNFKSLSNDFHLPVIARNKLKNGLSKNLWYEQLVPREAHFFSIIMIPEEDTNRGHFSKAVTNKRIQVGANATVGMGQCFFSQPFKEKSNEN